MSGSHISRQVSGRKAGIHRASKSMSQACAAAIVGLGFAVGSAEGAILHWQGGAGDLLDPNWHHEQDNQDNQSPAPGDELNIGADGTVSFSGTFDPTVLRAGHPWQPNGRTDLQGPGTYNQTGGTLNVTAFTHLGVANAGTVNLSGDAALATPFLHVGWNSPTQTTMTLRDTAAVTAGFLEIGREANASGLVEIHDNATVTLNNNDRVIIGRFGNPATGEQSQGTLTMTGGNLTLQATGGGPAADFVVGWDGIGTVNMSGGTMDIANNFITAIAAADGDRPKSQATINHSGGTINAHRMFLSERGSTQYNLSGDGEVNVNLRLVLGLFAPNGVQSDATFTQSGGTVNTDLLGTAALGVSMLIGERGHGIYNLDGGVLDVPRTMWMGEWETSTAQMNITDGQATVGLDLGVSLRGTSAVVQSGGEMNIGRTVLISDGGLSMDATGTYEISGGQLEVGSDFVVGFRNGNGRFRVIGADGQINIGNNYFQDPNGRLFVQISDAGQLSLIDVGGDALFHDGTILEANFDDYPGWSVGESWDVLTAANIIDNGISFVGPDPLIDYRIVSGGNGQVLQVYVIPEPASLGLLGMGGLLLLRRRI